MRKLIEPEEAERRLQVIFPRTAFDTALSSPLAGLAVAALIYVDAVCSATDNADQVQWARPTTVLWMSVGTLAHSTDDERLAWRAAAAKGSKKVAALCEEWGETFTATYRDTTRESLRDETFNEWREHGALRKRAGLPNNSSRPSWSLLDHFADLFDPDLSAEEVEVAASAWRDEHLDPGAKLRVSFATAAENVKHAVIVKLPNSATGATRSLEAGKSSLIIKGVVETWSLSRLQTPVVLAISEPGDKVHLGEAIALQNLGITIDSKNVLPDIIMADLGTNPVHFWIIEVAASDGVIRKTRRAALLKWAAEQNIAADRCSFLTAFESRNSDAARRRLKDLAPGTWAWFAAEPNHELAWYEVVPGAGDE
ncbi:BsuBI/PstI family type II restriction endonuclease [Streptacidiphilus jiangxiensis]|uniref:BsuBI/PstI restriction endonuclease C-terminus n=1 Tax=Streptacidiphilus jiangxiensis TaxID=235985 RepID=A0A1H7ITW2_STRJI|nr:BsuBI/PstI family type II restriction endonuclease [Streptacidiphilus jiangxiensis]SEK65943.1 BsuBI/PstI restriction endonuclease C-terminus [Streptacidiphilus jiangxiensis]